MKKISADIVFPVSSPPLKNGVLITKDEGTILDVLPSADGIAEVEFYNGCICPGFINTHCHLELSHLKGKLPEKHGLIPFLKSVVDNREETKELKSEAMQHAESEMLENGIVAVGDISNTSDSFKLKTAGHLKYHTFIEVFNFNPENDRSTFEKGKALCGFAISSGLSASIVPHAPYSASAELLKLIGNHSFQESLPVCIHMQESMEENKLYENGDGLFPGFYKELGIDVVFFIPSGKRSISYCIENLLPFHNLLLVHNTYTSYEDIQTSLNIARKKNKEANLFWCFCPNANMYIENRLPDIGLFQKANVNITLGTDSLASNSTLSILEEMKTIAHHYPEVSLETLIQWATKNGADFLKMQGMLGTLEQGKRPGINLIQGTDLQKGKLREDAKVKKII